MKNGLFGTLLAVVSCLLGFMGLGMMDLGLDFLEALITNAFHDLSGYYVMGFFIVIILAILGIRSGLIERLRDLV